MSLARLARASRTKWIGREFLVCIALSAFVSAALAQSPSDGTEQPAGIFAAAAVRSALDRASSQPGRSSDLLSILQFGTLSTEGAVRDDSVPAAFDPTLVAAIAAASSTDDVLLRRQATRLLINVAAQENVCGIIDSLLDPGLQPEARANLTLIAEAVGARLDPSREVRGWIDSVTIDRMRPALGPDDFDPRLDRNIGWFMTCLALPRIGHLYVPFAAQTPIRVFPHTGDDPATGAKIAAALKEAGIDVSAVDNQVDSFGGGIDYGVPDPTGAHLRQAAAVASVINPLLPRPLDLRAQSPKGGMTEGWVGVWLATPK